MTPFFSKTITAIPAVLPSSSLLRLFQHPKSPSHSSNGINLHRSNDSRCSLFRIYSQKSRLTNSTNIFRNSLDTVPNEREIKFFFQPSASRPNGPDPIVLKINGFIIWK